MNPKDKFSLLDGKVEIEIRSKSPAGQGYMPIIIKENHYNISLNGHLVNLPESVLQEIINVLSTKENSVNIKIDTISIEELREKYELKYGTKVPINMKNNNNWIIGKINDIK